MRQKTIGMDVSRKVDEFAKVAVLASSLAVASCAAKSEPKMATASAAIKPTASLVKPAIDDDIKINWRGADHKVASDEDKKSIALVEPFGNVFCDDKPSSTVKSDTAFGVTVDYQTERRYVKVGDEIPIHYDANNKWSCKVTKVDEKGIEVSLGSSSMRYQYGKQVTVGEFILRFSMTALNICPDGSASITLTHPVKFSKAKPGSANNYVSNPYVKYLKGRALLHENDLVLRVDLMFEKRGFIEWRVSKIDDNGVELNAKMEIFMSESAARPYKVGYGDPVQLSPFSASVKAEKGPFPWTAYVELIPPKSYLELIPSKQ